MVNAPPLTALSQPSRYYKEDVGELRGLHDLPNELLIASFSYLALQDLKAVRLVSQLCSAAAFACVSIKRIRVVFLSDSLRFLENVALHEWFRQTLQTVEFDVSYYDKRVAESMTTFEKINLHRGYIAKRKTFSLASLGAQHWEPEERVRERKNINEYQEILPEMHKEYIRLYEDQQEAHANGQHMIRLTQTLKKLPNLKIVKISDYGDLHKWPKNASGIWNTTSGGDIFYDNCLRPMRWFEYGCQYHKPICQFYEDQYGKESADRTILVPHKHLAPEKELRITPPVHLIPDICAAIAAAGVPLDYLEIELRNPRNRYSLMLSAEQRQAIESAARLADRVGLTVTGEESSFSFYDWPQGGMRVHGWEDFVGALPGVETSFPSIVPRYSGKPHNRDLYD